MKADVSVLIPARNEMWLNQTIEDILAHSELNTDIFIGLDGKWPDPGLEIPMHPRVHIVFEPQVIGQRAMTNVLCRLSNAKYVVKTDAHCAFEQGWDRKMVEAFEELGDDVTMVPVMRNLHVFDWICPDGHRRYQSPSAPCAECGKETMREAIWNPKRSPQSTSYRFDKTLQFQYWNEYKEKQEGDLVETMSLQGSFFMLTREKYWELNICDEAAGSWGHQGSEVAIKTWLSGGRVICNRRTWYAHLFRTQGADFGFPWDYQESEIQKTRQYFRDLFLNDRYEKAVRPLQWLIDKFAPIPDWHFPDPKKKL